MRNYTRKNNEEKQEYSIYSRVWFNTPELAPVQIMRRLQRFGIKPDGIIIFLSNEPPFKPTQRLRYRGACSAEAHSCRRSLLPRPLGRLKSIKPLSAITPGEQHTSPFRAKYLIYHVSCFSTGCSGSKTQLAIRRCTAYERGSIPNGPEGDCKGGAPLGATRLPLKGRGGSLPPSPSRASACLGHTPLS